MDGGVLDEMLSADINASMNYSVMTTRSVIKNAANICSVFWRRWGGFGEGGGVSRRAGPAAEESAEDKHDKLADHLFN